MFCLNYFFFKNTNFVQLNKKKSKDYFLNNNYENLVVKNTFIHKKNILNKKYLIFLFRINNNYYYKFNNLNFFFIKNFLNSLKNFILNEMKFVIVSLDNKLVLPYYLNLFKQDEIYNYKNFLFYDTMLLNYKNWLYFFKKFTKKFNIKSIFFLDYENLTKFFTVYNKVELIKFSILSNSLINVYFDYYFFSNKSEKLFYITIFLNYFMSVFFNNLNEKFLKNKFLYTKKLKKLICKQKLFL